MSITCFTGTIDDLIVESDGVVILWQIHEPAVVDPDVVLRLVAVTVHGARTAAVSA